MKKQKSKARLLREQANSIIENKVQHNLTRTQYKRDSAKFIRFCRENYNCEDFEECKNYIQSYADTLQIKGYTASTIHTYLSAVCVTWNIPLSIIDKPIRHIAEYSKGRTKYKSEYRKSEDLDNEKWQELIEFQRRVGIRRSELKRLTGKDILKWGPSYFVFVKNGKGGKDSDILLADEDADFVRKYFDGKEDEEPLFDSSYFKNDLNLHYLRAIHAKEMYAKFEKKVKENPTYRADLKNLIIDYWKKSNFDKRTGKPKPFPYKSLEGKYILRGKNRTFAIQNKMPIVYDRLLLKAVSVLCLSHYRTDITILYMLYT